MRLNTMTMTNYGSIDCQEESKIIVRFPGNYGTDDMRRSTVKVSRADQQTYQGRVRIAEAARKCEPANLVSLNSYNLSKM